MKWIQERSDRLFAGLVAVSLLTFVVMILHKAGHFQDRFAHETTTPVIIQDPPKDWDAALAATKQAHVELENPPRWQVNSSRGSLFVSEPYLLQGGAVIKVEKSSIQNDSRTGKLIPSSWFIDFGLSPLEKGAARQDPDKDGFTNEAEWRAGTDPTDKNSHPPYYSELFLKQVIHIPFHLVFAASNGDGTKPESLEFDINAVDRRQPTMRVKIGDMVPGTVFKVQKFTAKEAPNYRTNSVEDVSELTLINTRTKELITLVRTQVTNAPDTDVIFDYQWGLSRGDIRVKKSQEFALKPEPEKLYKLVEIEDEVASIRLPDGSMYPVPRDVRPVIFEANGLRFDR